MKCGRKYLRVIVSGMSCSFFFFIVSEEVTHAVLIQTLRVKSLFTLTYIFKVMLELLQRRTEKRVRRKMTCVVLRQQLLGDQNVLRSCAGKNTRGSSVDTPSPALRAPVSSFFPEQAHLATYPWMTSVFFSTSQAVRGDEEKAHVNTELRRDEY